MEVRFKKLIPTAVIPTQAHKGDAGFDLTATSRKVDGDGNIVYGTGIAMEIPEGYVGLVFPRSSNAKRSLLLTNSVGVIDSTYRGEILLKYAVASKGDDYTPNFYKIGDRIGQIIIMPYPYVTFVETDELSASVRGEGGYGSTGD